MYEHLRRGLRNQIPKFEIGASFSQIINPYITQGSGIQSPYNSQPITTNPQPNLNVNLTDYIQQDQKRQQQEYEAKLFSTPASNGGGDNTGDSGKSKINQLLNKGLNSTRDYLVQNAGQIANFGLNAANSWATSGVEQGGLMRSINGVNNFINSIPVGDKFNTLFRTYTTGLNVINKLGGSYVSKYQADQNLMADMGSSYGGFSDLAQRAADATGKTYGLFNGGGKRRAKRLKNEAIRQENIVSDINSTAQDQFAMAGNDLNYTRYQFNQNGSWNQALMRVAKLGAKLELKDEVFSEDSWEPQLFKDGGNIEDDIFSEDSWEPTISLQESGQVEKWDFETWFNSIPPGYRASQYDYQMAFNVLDKETLKNHAKDPNQYHLPSVSGVEDKDGRIPFLKLGKRGENKEVDKEFTEFYEHDRGKDFRSKYDVIYDKDRYYYVPKKFKDGGELSKGESELEKTNQKNIIPEGALHKERHNMENAEDLTKKGIPVIDNNGEQQAEIERDEIVFTLEVTKKLEELYNKYQDASNKEKDELAIEAGKILVYEILYNTEDRTNLISKCKEGGKLNET